MKNRPRQTETRNLAKGLICRGQSALADRGFAPRFLILADQMMTHSKCKEVPVDEVPFGYVMSACGGCIPALDECAAVSRHSCKP